jgi:hypothetical protein
MEDRLSKALEFANYRQTLNNQLQKSKIRAEGLLTVSKNGGSFKVSQELISFVDYLVRQQITEATLLDENTTPIHISDLEAFLDDITSRYFEVANDYLRDYESVRQSRNVRSIVQLKEDK